MQNSKNEAVLKEIKDFISMKFPIIDADSLGHDPNKEIAPEEYDKVKDEWDQIIKSRNKKRTSSNLEITRDIFQNNSIVFKSLLEEKTCIKRDEKCKDSDTDQDMSSDIEIQSSSDLEASDSKKSKSDNNKGDNLNIDEIDKKDKIELNNSNNKDDNLNIDEIDKNDKIELNKSNKRQKLDVENNEKTENKEIINTPNEVIKERLTSLLEEIKTDIDVSRLSDPPLQNLDRSSPNYDPVIGIYLIINKNLKKYITGHNLDKFVISHLKWSEQDFFMQKSKIKETLYGKFKKEYDRIYKKIEREKLAYYYYSKYCSIMELKSDDYYIMQQCVREQVACWMETWKNRISMYPKYYKYLDSFSIKTNNIKQENVVFAFMKDFENNGNKLKLKNEEFNMNINYLDPSKDVFLNFKINERDYVPIYKDVAIEAYGKEVSASIFLSFEALSAFMGLEKSRNNTAFTIPVQIRPIIENKSIKNGIFIEDPLLKPKYTYREKNEFYWYESLILNNTYPEEEFKVSYHYAHWRLSGKNVILRSLNRVVNEKNEHMRLRVKLEYQIPKVVKKWKKKIFEEYTMEETEKWWLDLSAGPYSKIIVSNIDMKQEKPMSSKILETPKDVLKLKHHFVEFKMEEVFKHLGIIIEFLEKQTIGSYILTYFPRENKINCYMASLCNPKEEIKILPEKDPMKNCVYDMYIAQKQSGKLSDEMCYRLNASITGKSCAHLPYTFPMKMGKKDRILKEERKNKRRAAGYEDHDKDLANDNKTILAIDYGDL